MLYILNNTYFPDTAVSNRLMGYYAALNEMNMEAVVVYLTPDHCHSKIQKEYKNIRIIYLWDSGKCGCLYDNPYIRFILSYVRLWKFISKLKAGDIVYTYGITPATKMILRKDGIKVFAEKTEHPSIKVGGRWSLSEKEMIHVAKQLDGLFVISEELRRVFTQYGVLNEKIKIINMTVDPSRFLGLNKTGGVKYIAYCGTISNSKDGVDKLIRAFSIVAKKVQDIKLYIIGKIPIEKEKTDNIELINALGIRERVVLTGVISAQDMPQMLKNAELLVLARPNNIQAKCGFPTKLGEYLLSENPVVVSRVGDIDKFLVHQESVLFAEPDNYCDFAEKILWVLNDKSAAERIGKNGARVAMREFNNEVETSKFVKFIYK